MTFAAPPVPAYPNDYHLPPAHLPRTAVVGVDGAERIYLVFRMPYTLAVTDFADAPACPTEPAFWAAVAEWVFADRLGPASGGGP